MYPHNIFIRITYYRGVVKRFFYLIERISFFVSKHIQRVLLPSSPGPAGQYSSFVNGIIGKGTNHSSFLQMTRCNPQTVPYSGTRGLHHFLLQNNVSKYVHMYSFCTGKYFHLNCVNTVLLSCLSPITVDKMYGPPTTLDFTKEASFTCNSLFVT